MIKERYLLFDSGCLKCTKIARDIENESKGWLSARSLRDPAIQILLNNSNIDWTWEPALIEVDFDKIVKYSGTKMAFRMLAGLGVVHAYRITQIVHKHSIRQYSESIDYKKRAFLRNSGAAALSTLAILPFGKILKSNVTIADINTVPSNILNSIKKGNAVNKGNYSEVRGELAKQRIKDALKFNPSKRLIENRSDLKIDRSGAKVYDVEWEDDTLVSHAGYIVGIPFGKPTNEGALLFGEIDGVSDALVIVTSIRKDELKLATSYMVRENEIVKDSIVFGSKGSSATRMLRSRIDRSISADCTIDCFSSCLPGWGCNALSLTICIASLIACPWSLVSCGSAVICSGICGYAVSRCTNYCCP